MSGFPRGGSGTGTISDITSADHSVTITGATGPTTDLSVASAGGTISRITSTGGTLTVTAPTGPTTNLEVVGGPYLASSVAGAGADTVVTGGLLTLVGTTNVESIIMAVPLSSMTQPAAAVPFNSQRLTGLGAPAATTDAAQAKNFLLSATYDEPSTAATPTTTSTSLVAIDTTNLTLSFTAISTIVVVELEAYVINLTGTAASILMFGLFTHSTTTQVGYTTSVAASSSANITERTHCLIRITGLTQGTAYQVDWAWAASVGTQTWVMGIRAAAGASSTNYGPAIMRAYAG